MNAEHAPDAHSGPSDRAGSGYETRDASVPALLKFGGGLIVSLVVVQFVMLGFYRVFVAERRQDGFGERRHLSFTSGRAHQTCPPLQGSTAGRTPFPWLRRRCPSLRVCNRNTRD